MSIARMAGLSLEAQAVEARAIALVKADLEGLVQQYRERFGVVVGTDLAREIFPDYTESLETKLKFAVAVQRSAARLADEVFARLVAESDGRNAVFTAGGTGAGKTTAIRAHAQSLHLFKNAGVIYDSNLNSLNSAVAKIELALAAGLRALVFYVFRNPVEAHLQGVLPRALEEGRTVPIEAHLRMHKDSRKTFLRLERRFAEGGRVSFYVLDNTGPRGSVRLMSVADLKSVEYHQEQVFAAIKEGLDHAYRRGAISESLYAASCGQAPEESGRGEERRET